MPKRISSRQKDVNELAAQVVKAATGGTSKEEKSLISQIMAEMGRKGGRKGGKRRMETMTQEARSQIALRAAASREPTITL